MKTAKALLISMAVLAVGIYTVAVYNAGRLHAVKNTTITYHAGICTFELDGKTYPRPMEGWVSR